MSAATAHMEHCQFCNGTGQSPRSRMRCPECHGAGTVEVWDEEPEPAPAPLTEREYAK